MHDITTTTRKDEAFLDALEDGILKVMKAKKATVAEKIAAINAGTRVAAIRHRVNGSEPDTGFFK